MEKFGWNGIKKNAKNITAGVLATIGSVGMHEAVSAQTVQDKTAAQTEQAVSTQEKTPFTVTYKSDSAFYRGIDKGVSIDMATANKIALSNAKNKIVVQINSQQSSVDVLHDVKIIDEKVFQDENGTYTYWVAIEMPK